MTTRDVEWTPCGRGEESYACSGCQCGLETRQVAQLRAEVERLRAALQRAADAPCTHCGVRWMHGEQPSAHFIAQQVLNAGTMTGLGAVEAFELMKGMALEFRRLRDATEDYFESHECPGEAQCSVCTKMAEALGRAKDR